MKQRCTKKKKNPPFVLVSAVTFSLGLCPPFWTPSRPLGVCRLGTARAGAARTLGALAWNWRDPESLRREVARARAERGGASGPRLGALGAARANQEARPSQALLPAPGRVADSGQRGGSAAGPARAAAARAAGLRRRRRAQCAPGSGRARHRTPPQPPAPGPRADTAPGASCVQTKALPLCRSARAGRRVRCLSRSESRLQTVGQFSEVSRV